MDLRESLLLEDDYFLTIFPSEGWRVVCYTSFFLLTGFFSLLVGLSWIDYFSYLSIFSILTDFSFAFLNCGFYYKGSYMEGVFGALYMISSFFMFFLVESLIC